MGILTRGANLLSDARAAVPKGSKRERLVDALEGGLDKTQDLLAGKYLGKLPEYLSPTKTAQYAPLAYGLIGAGGSVAGNILGGEEKDPGRILLEAAGAGGLGALLGSRIGALGQSSNLARAKYKDIAQVYGEASAPYINRGVLAAKAGATSTAKAALDKATQYGDKILAAQKKASSAVEGNRLEQGLYMAGLPAVAGIGGLIGGGASNLAQMTGVPGFQQGIDPESYTSSNMPGARQSIPTLQY